MIFQWKSRHVQCSQFSRSVVSDSLWPYESQHARPPCASPTPGVHPNSCASSWWCHPAISSSVIPFSRCPQSLPASGSFPMSQLFVWDGQSTGVSASASVLPKNTQDWSPLGWTGWISLQSKGSNTTSLANSLYWLHIALKAKSSQFSSVTQSCLTLCDPMNYIMPGFPVHHQLLELAQTHVHWSVMPSNHLILCHPLLLLPSNFPSIRLFSSESVLCIRWPKYWSFSFSISPSNDYSGLISFRIDWFDLLAVQRTLKSLLQHNSKASILWSSAFFMVQLSYPYMTTGKTTVFSQKTKSKLLQSGLSWPLPISAHHLPCSSQWSSCTELPFLCQMTQAPFFICSWTHYCSKYVIFCEIFWGKSQINRDVWNLEQWCEENAGDNQKEERSSEQGNWDYFPILSRAHYPSIQYLLTEQISYTAHSLCKILSQVLWKINSFT